MSKILYIFDHVDAKSRSPIAFEAKKNGFDVTIGLVGGGNQIYDELKDFDVLHIPKPKNKFGPFGVLQTIKNIKKAITATSPDLVHAVTLKYSFLVGLACAKQQKFKIIYTIAGLGFLFRSHGFKPFFIRTLITPFLKKALKNKSATLIFQNEDDRDLLVRKRYVHADQTRLVISSGVDLERFKPDFDAYIDPSRVVMVTRLVHEKGIEIFAKAAKNILSKGSNARFDVIGGLTTHNPNAMTQSDMDQIVKDTGISWLGRVDNIPQVYRQASIVVYPSYYGEGVPRVLIEACASGKPIITTDHPGCKETVIQGENGFLVPIKDVQTTQEAIETLLGDRLLQKSMGQNSRQIAKRKFDVRLIMKQTFDVYKEVLDA